MFTYLNVITSSENYAQRESIPGEIVGENGGPGSHSNRDEEVRGNIVKETDLGLRNANDTYNQVT